MRHAILIACTLLAGCASAPPRIEVQRVEVPVPKPVYCSIDWPAWPPSAFDAYMTSQPKAPQATAIIGSLLEDRIARQQYIEALDAQARACTEKP